MKNKQTNKTTCEYTFRYAFETEEEWEKYDCSALSLFVLSHYLNIEDIESFASDSITDGIDDKKVDICHIDYETKKIIITQNYFSKTWNSKSAPSNKASDLNTAITWLFSVPIINVPVGLKEKAIELRDAVENGEIRNIELLFIHNCPESKNVKDELNAVSESLRHIIASTTNGNEKKISVSNREFGLNNIEYLFKSRKTQILIDNWINVPVGRNFLCEETNDWKAILTTVPASWIKKLHDNHKNDLFSANYREFLGINDDEENINSNIANSATDEPKNFWAYNNGITALTFELSFQTRVKKIRGISIINGAQTTGALGSISESSAKDARVLIRFVECNKSDIIGNIILFNNTQNAIKPEDMRSKDTRQSKIKDDFAEFNIEYYYRRSEQKILKNSITGKSIASPLCAFHGDPQTAFRNPKEIFKDNNTYEWVFPKEIDVAHIFLVKTLVTAIDKIKREYKQKQLNNTEKILDKEINRFLKYTASKHFLIFLMGFTAENIMNSPISELHNWKAKENQISSVNTSLVKAWMLTINTIFPFLIPIITEKGEERLYDVPRSDNLSKDVAREVSQRLAALEPTIGIQFNDLRKKTTI